MRHYISLVIIFITSRALNTQSIDYYREDLNRTTPELIESRNFKYETHWITTSDGYILTVFRIINPYVRHRSVKPVLLQHGFTGNSDEFLVTKTGFLQPNGIYREVEEEKYRKPTDCHKYRTVGKTQGFVLSACGHDVWLLNSRGNKYSTNHTTLDPMDSQFWRFTIDEMSLIDLPAVIQYIKSYTKQLKVTFIGYSMGNTLMFALMAERPDYSHQIDPFIALAPVTYMTKVSQRISRYKSFHRMFSSIPMRLIRFGFLRKFIVDFVGDEVPKHLHRLGEHLIDESSTFVVSQFLQWMYNRNFAKFDYGLKDNLRLYGQPQAPDYALANITSNRIALFQSSENDMFSNPTDVQRLKRQLNVKPMFDYRIPDRQWTHVDYLFNNKVDKYVISVILSIL